MSASFFAVLLTCGSPDFCFTDGTRIAQGDSVLAHGVARYRGLDRMGKTQWTPSCTSGPQTPQETTPLDALTLLHAASDDKQPLSTMRPSDAQES